MDRRLALLVSTALLLTGCENTEEEHLELPVARETPLGEQRVPAHAERERSVPASAPRERPSAPTGSPRLGTNLARVSDWSPEWPFVDAFRASRPWISGAHKTWDDGRPLDLDEHGWVRSLLPGQRARTLLLWGEKTHAPAGRYVVRYQGKGELDYRHGARVVESRPGRDVLELPEGSGGIELDIIETDPADPIRFIRVLMPGADEERPDAFHPAFLARLAPYGVLRFMDWARTNDVAPVEWSERPRIDDARWTTHGVPLEVQVALANRLGKHAWFTLPHTASDDYVRRFAAYVRDRLHPELKAYVEYSNEVWNGRFPQADWAREQGMRLGLAKDPNEARHRFYARRAREVFVLFEQTFGGTERLVRVVSSQAANQWVTRTILGHEDLAAHADALAIAPYFGASLGAPKRQAEVAALSVEELLARLEREELPEAAERMRAQAELARAHGLELIAYEGGQHLVAQGKGNKDSRLNALFDAVNRHPGMRALYREYLDEWSRHGGLFVHYVNCTSSGPSGRWGALEYLGQPREEAPKYDALVEWAERQPASTRR